MDDGTRQELQASIDLMELRRKEQGLTHSLAGRIGQAIEPVTSWAGFDWRTNIALLGGIAAKEVIVSTLSTAYAMNDEETSDFPGALPRLRVGTPASPSA